MKLFVVCMNDISAVHVLYNIEELNFQFIAAFAERHSLFLPKVTWELATAIPV